MRENVRLNLLCYHIFHSATADASASRSAARAERGSKVIVYGSGKL